LFSSGILRETFLNPSGAPEELPKDVHKNPEANTKPPAFQLKKTPVLEFPEDHFQEKTTHSGKK
jgi:hypothetical protein